VVRDTETRQLRPFLNAMQSILFGAAWFFVQHRSKIIFVIFALHPGDGGILVFLWAVLQALVQLAFRGDDYHDR